MTRSNRHVSNKQKYRTKLRHVRKQPETENFLEYAGPEFRMAHPAPRLPEDKTCMFAFSSFQIEVACCWGNLSLANLLGCAYYRAVNFKRRTSGNSV